MPSLPLPVPPPKRRHVRRRRDRAGMSLIEIIIVIVLVTTVMAVVAAGVMQSSERARCQETKLRMKKVEQQLQLYSATHKGKYPSTSDGLEVVRKDLGDDGLKDSWDHEFLYFSPGAQSGMDYELMSLGKDGVEGGSDLDSDIKSWAIDEACQ